jgi:hypothetical protein
VQACLVTPENDNQDCRNAAQAEFDAMGIKAVNGRAVNAGLTVSLDSLVAAAALTMPGDAFSASRTANGRLTGRCGDPADAHRDGQ